MQQLSAPKVQLSSTLAALPSVSVPMNPNELVSDISSIFLLKWEEWSGQFLATVDESGAPDCAKMNYSKTLITGKAEARRDGMGYCGHIHHVVWQTLEHDFGRAELIVTAQLRKIHAYASIKPHVSGEIVKYSHIVSACLNILSHYSYENKIASEPVMNSVLRKLPLQLQNNSMICVLSYDSHDKNMKVFNA